MEKERIDEALELLWVLNEEGHQGLNRFRLSSEDDDIDLVTGVLKAEGLVVVTDDTIQLTDKGRAQATGFDQETPAGGTALLRCLRDAR